MLSLQQVTLRRGPRVLFAKATFSLFRGERVGLVGANGAGKSSLFALLTGHLSTDEGSVVRQAGISIATVAQEAAPESRPAVEFVLDGDHELREIEHALQAAERDGDGVRVGALHARLESIGGYSARARAAKLLAGLGFDNAAVERPMDQFSGGWRRRIALAKALMARSDALLLDEPTNHLDLDAVLWLESWLNSYPGLLVVIAHDREFLDAIVTRIVSIEDGQVSVYTGHYSDFEAQRAERLAQQQNAFVRQQRQIQHILEFVARFKAQATKARQAQSRLKTLERLERIAPAHVDSAFSFEFAAPDKLPRPLLTLEAATVGYESRAIVSRVTRSIGPGDRIGLLGRNGAGKSTLTRALAGVSMLISGRRVAAQDLAIGYFAQHQLEQLDPEASPLMHLRRHGGSAIATGSEEDQRTYLGRFGFAGDRVFEAVAPFSGGEKARLVLALIVSQRPNLLLLDEPTNHLDLDMRHALGLALQDYPGAIVLVSHDRHLLRLVADELWLVADGRAVPFDGDLDDYARWLRTSADPPGEAPTPETQAFRGRDRKRQEAQRRQTLAPLRAKVLAHETELQQTSHALESIKQQMASEDLYKPEEKHKLTELLRRNTELTQRLATVEEAWLSASLELEQAQQQLKDP